MDSGAVLPQVTDIVWPVCLATKGDQSDPVTSSRQVSQDVVTADFGAGVYGVGHNLREKKYIHTG
jgi:hypothetical protein